MFAHQQQLPLDPPSTERGGKSPSQENRRIHGIDWLSYTFPSERIPDVIDAIRERLCDKSEAIASIPWKSFKHAVKFEGGAKISWHEDYNHAHLVLTGSECGALGIGLLSSFITRMLSIGKCCRIDLNIDIRQGEAIDPLTLDDWREQGYSVGYKRYQLHKDYGKAEGTGVTFAAGSRGSNGGGKHFRAYRKSIDQSKEHSHVRYEVEFSGERAIKVTQEISSLSGTGLEGLCRYIESTVLASIDFKEKGDARHTGRRKCLEAWQKFIDGIRLNRIATGRRIKPANRTREALKRQYSRFLYEHAKNNPNDYLSLLFEIRQLGKKQSERKQMVNAQHRAELNLYVDRVKRERREVVCEVLAKSGFDESQISDYLKNALADTLIKAL